MPYTNTLIRPMTNFNTAAASRTPTDMDLAVWSGEALEAFHATLSLIPRVSKQTISSGTTARFPITWKMGSEILEAGASVTGSEFETGYVEISLDTSPLIASHVVYDIDAMLAQYEFRGPVTRAMGKELAIQAEKRCFAILSNSAVVANDSDSSIPESITDSTLGISAGVWSNNSLDVLKYTGWTTANVGTAVETLLLGIDQVSNAFDDKFVPKEGRKLAVSNLLFNACRKYGLPSQPATVTSTTSYGGTQNLSPFGAPAITQGMPYAASLDYNGVEIFAVPAGLFSQAAVTTGPSKFRISTANVEAIMYHPEACAWVDKYGVAMETARQTGSLTWLTVAHSMHGGGALRPYCCVNLCGNGS